MWVWVRREEDGGGRRIKLEKREVKIVDGEQREIRETLELEGRMPAIWGS